MSFIIFQFNQSQYIQFDFSLSSSIIEYTSSKFNLNPYEGYISKPTITISLNPPKETDWIKGQTIDGYTIYTKETDKLYFYIIAKGYIDLLPKLIMNCIAASMILRKDVLLIHGLLLSNNKVLYGEPFSGKTTLARYLKQNRRQIEAICDDQVLIDLQNNTAYPIPYFYFDHTSPFNNAKVEIKPYSIKSIKPLNENQSLYKCSIMFLSQPFASRADIFICDESRKWSSFQKGFAQRIKERVQTIIEKYNFEIKD